MSDAPRNPHGTQHGITRRSSLAGAAVAALAAGTSTSAHAAPSLTLPNPPAYMPAFRDFDRSHTPAWYQANHPDWIVYKADGTTVAWEFGNTTYVPIDLQNPDVRTFYWNSFVQPKIDAGYPIIAFDNVLTFNGYGNAGHYDGTQWVAQYSGDRVDDVWAEAVLDWLSYLSGRLHAPLRDGGVPRVRRLPAAAHEHRDAVCGAGARCVRRPHPHLPARDDAGEPIFHGHCRGHTSRRDLDRSARLHGLRPTVDAAELRQRAVEPLRGIRP